MTKIIVYCLGFALIAINLLGCDAFVRKFTRKSKKEAPAEEMVLAPEEYKPPQMTKEEVYRQYFTYWKAWQDELIESLVQRKSQKKQIDCAEEAIKNLESLKALLNEDKQKKLDIYLNSLKDVREMVSRDAYGNNTTRYLQSAERIRMNILKDFSWRDIKDFLR